MADTTLAVVPVANPYSLLQSAIDRGASIEQVAELIKLAEWFEENQARKAYNQAFSDFKAEAVTIVKNTNVKSGPLVGQKYANLFDVVDVITPAMSAHGLSHSWKLTKDEKDWMEVTCTIRHVLGHAESVSMGAAPDVGAGRNPIQARGSAKSYLERYTLLAATGMAASDTDDDGNGLQQTAVENIMAQLGKITDPAELQEAFSTGYMLLAKRPEDQKKVKSAYDARKAVLVAAKGGK